MVMVMFNVSFVTMLVVKVVGVGDVGDWVSCNGSIVVINDVLFVVVAKIMLLWCVVINWVMVLGSVIGDLGTSVSVLVLSTISWLSLVITIRLTYVVNFVWVCVHCFVTYVSLV